MKYLIAAVLGLWPMIADAQLVMGKTMPVSAPLCFKREDAEAVVRKDHEKGFVEANALFQTLKWCRVVEVNLTPKAILLTLPAEPGRTVRVVEVKIERGNNKVTMYLITELEMVGVSDI